MLVAVEEHHVFLVMGIHCTDIGIGLPYLGNTIPFSMVLQVCASGNFDPLYAKKIAENSTDPMPLIGRFLI